MEPIPPVCQPLKDRIEELRVELAGITIPADGTSQEKAAARRRMNELTIEIDRLEERLKACIANPPPPTSTGQAPLPVEPDLRITSIEVVQCVQRPNNSVALVLRKPTLVRVFVSSGITSGRDFGAGPNRWPNVDGTLTVTDLDTGRVVHSADTSSGPPITAQPAPAIDRGNFLHSLNFRLPLGLLSTNVRIRAQAFAGDRTDTRRGRQTSSEVSVTFVPRGRQQVLPILIGERFPRGPDREPLAPPNRDQFNALLFKGALPRFPLEGFLVQPEITHTTQFNLSIEGNWKVVLGQIASLILLAPQFQGIRCGVVRDAGDNAQAGIGSPRIVLFREASLVCEVERPDTFAHEMGHAFGVRHSACDGTERGLDRRLSGFGLMDQPGWNSEVDLTLSVIPAGNGDAMSYCPLRWPSTKFYEIIADEAPI